MIPAQKQNFKPVWVEKKKDAVMPEWGAITRVAGSFVSMTLLGSYFVLFFYALWIPCIFYRGKFTLKPSKDVALPYLVAGLCLLSSIWAEYLENTLRAGLEFSSLIMCAAIMMRVVTFKSFVKGIILGASLSLVITLVLQHISSRGGALTGSLGSKNQVGFIAEIGFLCVVISWNFYKGVIERVVFSLIPAAICSACLVLSHSATAVATLLATLAISLVCYIVGRIQKNYRLPVLITTFIFAIILSVFSSMVNIKDMGLQAMGKDSTLTGRTQLWSEGLKAGSENPILGVGFGGFWVVGRPEAEKIWYQFFIKGRSGFHFHNLFIEIFVELGIVGVLLWTWLYLSSLTKSAKYLLRYGASAEAVFYISTMSMFLMRAFFEVDVTAPYGYAPLLLFSVVMRITTALQTTHLSHLPDAPLKTFSSADHSLFSPRKSS